MYSLVGLFAIFCGLYPRLWDIPYPGLMSLIPVTGTLIILDSAPASPGNRLLALKPLVWIGLISYPLYLWHWPIFSFLRIMESGTPAPRFLWLGTLLAFVLAALTWCFVELPIRRTAVKEHPKGKFVLGGLCAFMVTLFAVSYGVVRLDLSSRMALPRSRDYETAAEQIRDIRRNASCPQKIQNTGDEPVIALIGDSHARTLLLGVSEFAFQCGYRMIGMEKPGCIVLDGIANGKTPREKEQCAKTTDSILNALEQTPNISHVLIVARGPMYITGTGFGPAEPEEYLDSIVSTRDDDSRETPERLFQRGLESTFLRLKARGFRVGFLLQVPELGISAQDCLYRPLRLTSPKSCKVPYAIYRERMRRYRELVLEVKARHDDLIVIDPEPLFCNQKECTGFIDGKLLYRDDDHLSISGSFHVAPLVLEALGISARGLDKRSAQSGALSVEANSTRSEGL
jgi:hypothetical protein